MTLVRVSQVCCFSLVIMETDFILKYAARWCLCLCENVDNMGYFKRSFDKDGVEVVKIVVFFWVCIVSMLQSGVAMAHGGVSMEEDLCVMKLGTYRSHFTGYQPEKRSTQEFCEDIPEIGN